MRFLKLLLFLSLSNFDAISQTSGCLISNTFYTDYLGTVTDSPADNSYPGSPNVYDVNGITYGINYQSYDVCNTVKSSDNGYISRSGPLCFVMSATQYNSYPGHVTPTYPGGNGTYETYSITVSNCPLDDYLPYLIIITGVVGFFFLRQKLLITSTNWD